MVKNHGFNGPGKRAAELPWTCVVGLLRHGGDDDRSGYILRERGSIFLQFFPGRSNRVGLDSGAPVPSCLN